VNFDFLRKLFKMNKSTYDDILKTTNDIDDLLAHTFD